MDCVHSKQGPIRLDLFQPEWGKQLPAATEIVAPRSWRERDDYGIALRWMNLTLELFSSDLIVCARWATDELARLEPPTGYKPS